jgi:hypothetical protein
MTRFTALLLCTVVLSGCTNPGGLRTVTAARQPAGSATDRALIAEYVRSLTPGTRVRVERLDAGAVTGTLMKATDQYIVVQRHTRLPEPPEHIAIDQIVQVTPEVRNGTAKAIGIGAAAGAAAALGVFLAILAIYAD